MSLLRINAFHETNQDPLYTQTNTLVTRNITNIENMGRIRSLSLETAHQASDLGVSGVPPIRHITTEILMKILNGAVSFKRCGP
jgi:iron complex outermembrane recepter protein